MKTNRNKKARKGFTLVELMIAMVINLLVLAGLFTLLLMYAQTTRGVMLQAELDAGGRRAVRQLQIDVRRSLRVENPWPNRLNVYFTDGTEAVYRFTNVGKLIYDPDGSGPLPQQTMMNGKTMGMDRASGRAFSITEVAGRPTQVHFTFSLVDPFDRDGLQVYSINTTISGRIPTPSAP